MSTSNATQHDPKPGCVPLPADTRAAPQKFLYIKFYYNHGTKRLSISHPTAKLAPSRSFMAIGAIELLCTQESPRWFLSKPGFEAMSYVSGSYFINYITLN
ncbi:hypothetical protein TWF225_008327 [Orbilia oligospora]|nr:hypothetical protein TWF225_008327 [Orbilia oligospora]KAF3254772.1 hypothetical protein TWF128_006085 [Orbilia oligospora]KAF3269064.1 hypothetical protein TWF217_010334 [Orbilia oligospora]KAF3290553.1 hypothetical protein TWF132_006875 [Orbilia oligospora]